MSSRPRVCRRTLVVALTVLAVAASCSDGGSSAHGAARTTTTTHRKHRRTGSSSTTVAPTVSTTTATTTNVPAPGATGPEPGDTPTTQPTTSGAVACGARKPVITAAVLSSHLGPVPTGSYMVNNCRVSTTAPIWAAVTLTPRPGQSVAPLTVVVERIGSIWTLHSYGAGRTGCDAPPPVPAELGLGC